MRRLRIRQIDELHRNTDKHRFSKQFTVPQSNQESFLSQRTGMMSAKRCGGIPLFCSISDVKYVLHLCHLAFTPEQTNHKSQKELGMFCLMRQNKMEYELCEIRIQKWLIFVEISDKQSYIQKEKK